MTTDQRVTCGSCGRPLRAAASIAAGRGPVCRAKIRRAAESEALAGFKPEQIEKARELIADSGIVPTSRVGVYAAVSSKGDIFYVAEADACTCPAGQHGRLCYHIAAAKMLDAAIPGRKAA